MATIKRNWTVELSTPTPRRWTMYRGLASDGRRGLIVGGQYFRTLNVRIPEISASLNVAPLKITLQIGNADNVATDLAFDAANLRAAVAINRLTFADTPWSPGVPPVVASSEIWFAGFLGTPSFDDGRELISIVCHANVGRRGSSPSTQSRKIMEHHTPPAKGAKLTVMVITGGD